MNKSSNLSILNKWKLFFLLCAVEGLAAFFWTAGISSDTESSFFLGFSKTRLVLLFATLLPVLLFFSFSLSKKLLEWSINKITGFKHPWVLFLLGTAGTVSGILLPQILFSIYKTSGEFFYLAVFQRLLPIFSWLIFISLQLLFTLQITLHTCKWQNLKARSRMYRLGVIILAFFVVIWVIIASTNYGLTPDIIGWGTTAVSLLEWQIWLSWFICSGLIVLFVSETKFSQSIRRFKHLDLVIALGIYLLTLLIWIGQPVVPAYFATPGREPNYEIYPFSDGAFYGHFAQNLLIGNGFKGDEIPPRPLYILFLAAIHAVAGQDYVNVINLQTVFLAFLPLVLYFIGKELHSRPAGILLALFSIFKEWTAVVTAPIALGSSNLKLFFADVPASLGISLFVLFAILWLKSRDKNPLFALISGGLMGLQMLIRTQSLILLGPLFLIALILYFPKWKKWVFSCILLVLGVGISIFPWLWRNYQITGEFVFDHPDSQTRSIAMRLSPTGKENPLRLPGEDDAAYTERLSDIIMTYYKTEPGRIISFVGSQYIHCQINNLLILPVRNGINSFADLVFPETAFWQKDYTNLNPGQTALIFINLALISLGLGAVWKKTGFIGLVPLFSYLTYDFSVAAARYSGGRYLIPVDWVLLFYYAVGLIEITYLVLLLFNVQISPLPNLKKEPAGQTQKAETGFKKKILRGTIIGLCFLLIGSSIPLSEKIVPEKYPALPREELQEKFQKSLDETSLSDEDLQKIDELFKDETLFMGYGRDIYPRFYHANDGEPLSDKTGYRVLDYDRFTFLLVSPTNTLVMLKNAESPEVFPNASDVLLLGCQHTNYIDAALVILPEEGVVYTADNLKTFTCTPAETEEEAEE